MKIKLESEAEWAEKDGNLDLVTLDGHTPGGVIDGEDGIQIWTIRNGREGSYKSVDAAKSILLEKLNCKEIA